MPKRTPQYCCFCGGKRSLGEGVFCCEKYRQRVDNARESHSKEDRRRPPANYGTRLATGFKMLHRDGDD